MNQDRELTNDERDAVSGGVSYEGQCTPCHGSSQSSGGPPSAPANAATMALWNGLLRLHGY